MKTYPLLIQKNILLPISIIGLVFAFIGSLFKIVHWHFGFITPNVFLSISIVFSLLSMFVVLLDIIKNPIKNKLLWIIPLLFLGNLVSIIYLMTREAHLKRAMK